MQKEEIRLSGFALPWRADAAFPSFLFLAAWWGCLMVRVMMKQVVSLCAASFAFFFLSGCDRAPSSGEKRASSAAEREKPSAVRKEAETWRARLDAAVAGAVREKENGSEHVKALNDVAAP